MIYSYLPKASNVNKGCMELTWTSVRVYNFYLLAIQIFELTIPKVYKPTASFPFISHRSKSINTSKQDEDCDHSEYLIDFCSEKFEESRGSCYTNLEVREVTYRSSSSFYSSIVSINSTWNWQSEEDSIDTSDMKIVTEW